MLRQFGDFTKQDEDTISQLTYSASESSV